MDRTVRAVLDAKEKLHAAKKNLAAKYNSGVISIALNIPYPERKEERHTAVFEAAVSAVQNALESYGITTNEISDFSNEAGRCLVISANGHLLSLKELCVQIENEHKWGRLFDIDVWDCDGRPIKRSEIGYDKRRCLICDDYAVHCIVSGKHTKNEVMEQINRLLAQES